MRIRIAYFFFFVKPFMKIGLLFFEFLRVKNKRKLFTKQKKCGILFLTINGRIFIVRGTILNAFVVEK